MQIESFPFFLVCRKMEKRIEMWTGPMFCGKTTMLISTVKAFQKVGKEVLVVKYSADDRYQRDGCSEVVSHEGQRIGAMAFSKLSDISPAMIKSNDVIAIDEGHFFEDLTSGVRDLKMKYGRVVLVAGLDRDYRKVPWSSTLNLRSHCDQLHEMQAICQWCGNPAFYTKLLDGTPSKDNILIGGSEKYAPVCENHF